MPAWKGVLSEAEIWHVVNYLKSEWTESKAGHKVKDAIFGTDTKAHASTNSIVSE